VQSKPAENYKSIHIPRSRQSFQSHQLPFSLLSIRLPTTKPKVPPNNPALSLDSNLKQLVRVENVHSTRDESEVVAAARNGELADEDARGVPANLWKKKKVSLASPKT
jgi:hypothetical protein